MVTGDVIPPLCTSSMHVQLLNYPQTNTLCIKYIVFGLCEVGEGTKKGKIIKSKMKSRVFMLDTVAKESLRVEVAMKTVHDGEREGRIL